VDSGEDVIEVRAFRTLILNIALLFLCVYIFVYSTVQHSTVQKWIVRYSTGQCRAFIVVSQVLSALVCRRHGES